MTSANDEIFLWVLSLREGEGGGCTAWVGVTIPDRLAENKEPLETFTRIPDSKILDRSTEATEKEMQALRRALDENPNFPIEEWESFLWPTKSQVVAYIEKFNANPLQFTDEELALLRSLVALPYPSGESPFGEAVEVLAAWRWKEPCNDICQEFLPRVAATKRPPIEHLPAMGCLHTTIGEVKAVAVDHDPESGLLRIVTLDEIHPGGRSVDEILEAPCSGDDEFGIFKHTLLVVDENLFGSEENF